MEQSIHFHRMIPVRYDVDVFIAGGGPAGVAAAVAAARQGASVYLAEGSGCFGGMGTNALVPAFMLFSDGIHFLAGGIGEEIYRNLKQEAEVIFDQPPLGVGIDAEALKRVYDRMMESSGADFSFHTQLIAVDVVNGSVQYVICAAKSGIFGVKAKVYIDATGDGDLAAWAGADTLKGDEQGEMMPGTLCSLWANVDWAARDQMSMADAAFLEEAFAEGIFTAEDRHLPGMWKTSPDTAGGNIGHTFGVDGTDERSLTNALLWGRKYTLEYEHYYRKYFEKAFGQMRLVATGAALGIRETRRVIGDYVLSVDDFIRRASFEDEIGRYSYNVDIHRRSDEKEEYDKFYKEHTSMRYKTGESYGIPYRILTPRRLENVLVAGRCVSTDRPMQSSVRVMPGCYITGQAAGVAAYLAAREDCSVHAVDVKELQQRLLKMGAYLPNA